MKKRSKKSFQKPLRSKKKSKSSRRTLNKWNRGKSGTRRRKLRLSEKTSLPIDAVTQTFAVIGIKGSGKSFTAGVLVEEMLTVKAQVCILDPVGNWYGLRLAANGKGKGFEIPIFGGRHADIPLEPTGGRLMAKVLYEHETSAIIDLSSFRKSQRVQFVADFAEELFFIKNEDNPTPIHIVLEEAQLFAPQRPGPKTARMLGAIEDLVRLGRNRGIGVTMITQRPQSVNKEVLNQTECLIVGRLVGKHERKAISDWIREQGVDIEELVDTLPSMKTGRFWIWSPSWLEMFKKVKIRKKKTYDSTATPKVGSRRPRAGKLTPVDMKRITSEMAETIEQVNANDPKHLKKRIRELETQLASDEQVEEVEVVKLKKMKVPVIKKSELKRMDRTREKLHLAVSEALEMTGRFDTMFSNAARLMKVDEFGPCCDHGWHCLDAAAKVKTGKKYDKKVGDTYKYKMTGVNKDGDEIPLKTTTDSGVKMAKGARRMLQGLAQMYPKYGTKRQMAVLGKISLKSSSVGTYSRALLSAKLIESVGGKLYKLTDEGKDFLGGVKKMDPQELIAAWSKSLPAGARKMFDKLVEIHPSGLPSSELAEEVGISLTSSSVGTYTRMLKGYGLAVEEDGEFIASDDLFKK